MGSANRSIPEQLKVLCDGLPGSEAYLMHDHPAYRAGKKCFVIGGEDGLSVKVPLMDQPLWLDDPRFTRTHYIGQHGWISFDLDDRITWAEVERLVLISYRLAASKKMLKEFDAR